MRLLYEPPGPKDTPVAAEGVTLHVLTPGMTFDLVSERGVFTPR